MPPGHTCLKIKFRVSGGFTFTSRVQTISTVLCSALHTNWTTPETLVLIAVARPACSGTGRIYARTLATDYRLSCNAGRHHGQCELKLSQPSLWSAVVSMLETGFVDHQSQQR